MHPIRLRSAPLHLRYPRSLESFLWRFDPFITRLDDFGVDMRSMAALVADHANTFGDL